MKKEKLNRKAKIEDLKLTGALFLTALSIMQGVRVMIIGSIFL
jgi:hypothetical protein